ncbi:MAG: hypothetical protein ABIP34_04175, partial [Rhodoferax sp.]|uniref:hypothetical protein n=1 Tax=Rhodoferax sp. TaxID=50421 RepID=UPI0032673E53
LVFCSPLAMIFSSRLRGFYGLELISSKPVFRLGGAKFIGSFYAHFPSTPQPLKGRLAARGG